VDKSPEAFRTISEVAGVLDVPPHVLRFWETRFTQVKPVKRGGGRRYYRPDDVKLLRGIRGLLYDDGMTIKGVQKILRERGVRHVIGLGTLPETEPEVVSAPEIPAATPAAPPVTAPAASAMPPPAQAAKMPQADLFGAPADVEVAERPARAAAARVDKAALRDLLAELQALRAVMTGDRSD
jgi:DNA-binding transcriptional MerR regulator